MASHRQINLAAFDIGGVVAHIDRASFRAHLQKHSVCQLEFFDRDFISTQKGQMPARRFIEKKCQQFALPLDDTVNAFCAMLKTSERSNEILAQLKIPYLFISNINELHYEHFVRINLISKFARDASLLSYRVGLLKPAPIFFQNLHELVDGPPSSILFIDDKPENLLAADNFALQTMLCHAPDDLPKLLARKNII